ncbi:hypothetical protein Bca52824_095845 [Brassica carinata]|uniref:Bifunctional inhibitor/plant lipid transfer protein/seed storage helical domain-containing protein n=1 Tax=Brassica carinata TaxID=52824 RepID=A0A8X7THT3_BRACI|nr:hypothetical protein Bca52824_095845 [Brassica carinata]
MELNTKLVFITLVLALTLTAATGELCGMSIADLYSCKPYGPCCNTLAKADVQCLCKQKTKTSPFLSGINLDLASKLPEKCGLSKGTC